METPMFIRSPTYYDFTKKIGLFMISKYSLHNGFNFSQLFCSTIRRLQFYFSSFFFIPFLQYTRSFFNLLTVITTLPCYLLYFSYS